MLHPTVLSNLSGIDMDDYSTLIGCYIGLWLPITFVGIYLGPDVFFDELVKGFHTFCDWIGGMF